MKIDVRRDNRFWRCAQCAFTTGSPGPSGRLKITVELRLQFLGIVLVTAAHMGRGARRLAAKFTRSRLL